MLDLPSIQEPERGTEPVRPPKLDVVFKILFADPRSRRALVAVLTGRQVDVESDLDTSDD
jgi:hypothetical protein